MPHISGQKIKKEILLEIHRRLVTTLKKAGSNNKMDTILDELLTETEEIMIAKRLSIIFLLGQGVSTYFIYTHLGVSPRTVSYMKERFDDGQYVSIKKLFSHKKEREEMWNYIEIIVRGGMPDRGRGRWKGFPRLTN